MKTTNLSSFVRTVENLPAIIDKLPQELEFFNDGVISSYYVPFEHVNASAKLVICGITPGFQQAKSL